MKSSQLITILDKLVSYKTVAENSDEIENCLNYLDNQLSFYPWIKKQYKVDGNQSRVWLTEDTTKPDVVMYVHLDVVPASKSLFKLHKQGDRLVGRGVSDMKFAAAIYVVVLKELLSSKKLPYSLAVMAVTDEERGGVSGAKYLVDKEGYRPKVVLMPDGGDGWSVVKKAKGATWVRLETRGKSAHASMPWEGENAIAEMGEVINYINKKYKAPKNGVWKTTINLGKIEGGTTPNQVADSASLIADVRSISDLSLEEVVSDLRDKFSKLKLTKLVNKSAFTISENNKYLKNWFDVLREKIDDKDLPSQILCHENGSGDHHYFSEKGSSVIVSKPVGGLIHTEDEWLSEEGLYLYAGVVGGWLRKVDFS